MCDFPLRTNRRTEMLNITAEVARVVDEMGLQDGVCTVFVPHTTAGVTINENADPDVQRDILREINKIVPFDDDYSHAEGNAAAHLKSSLVGCSVQVIVRGGKLVLGTWQGIFFCEFDGPRSRRIIVDAR